MKPSKPVSSVLTLVVLVCLCTVVCFSQTRYLVTNDDNASGNSATFYTVGSSGSLTQASVVPTGGFGLGGGFFSSGRVAVVRSDNGCIYVSNAGSIPGSVSAIVESTLTLAGTFNGSAGDSGDTSGIGLTLTRSVLYAAFTASGTIGAFQIHSDCTLTFMQDVTAIGLFGGVVDGMKAHGNTLVVAYVDGSVGSFDISNGVPVSNNDLQQSDGNIRFGTFPAGVDVSRSGNWAIFGDANAAGLSVIEVADISSGKISSTKAYTVGSGSNSNNVWLSPDDRLIYISNNYSGQVTAVFFNYFKGTVGPNCMSPVLNNFNSTWFFTGQVVTATTTPTGSKLYVAEWGGGNPSSVGIVRIDVSGTSCTLTEVVGSPVSDPQSPGLLSIGVLPNRPFH